MRLIKLKIENFASYKCEEINFDALGNFVACHGITGAGKTTLLIDAITFALFGSAYGRKNVGKIVMSPNSNSCRVELIFDVDGKKYRVVRRVSRIGNRAETKAFLFGPNDLNRVCAQGVKNVNEKIKEIIGLDYDTFLRTIAVRQGDVSSMIFSPGTLGKLKTLIQIFNLDFSKIQKDVRKQLDKIKSEYSKLKGEYSVLLWKLRDPKEIEEEIRKYNEKKLTLQARQKEIEEKLENYHRMRDTLLKQKWEIESNLKQVEHDKMNIEKAKKVLNKIKEYIPDQENIKKLPSKVDILQKVVELLSKAEKLREDGINYAHIQEKIAALKTKLQTILQKIKDKEAIEKEHLNVYAKLKFVESSYEYLSRESVNKCPLCGSELSEVKIRELLNKFERDRKILEEKLRELEIQLKEINQLEQKEAEIKKEIEFLKKEKTEKQRKLSQFKSILEEIKGIKNSLGLRKDISLLELRKICIDLLRYAEKIRDFLKYTLKDDYMFDTEINNLRNKLNSINNQINHIESTIRKLRKEQRLIDSELARIDEKIRNLKKELQEAQEIQKRFEEIKKKLSKLEKEKRIYEILDKIFDEKGLPSYLLGYYLEAIETFANRFLSRILPRIRVKIVKVTSRGGEDIDIEIYDGSYKRPFFTFSGGEQILLGFALRFALARVLAQFRFGKKISFMIIDEGFGPISEDLRRLLLDTLREFAREIGQIIIISHVPDVKEYEAFDSYIIVEKKGEESKVKIEKGSIQKAQ